ncbi:MAG: hypothetical protein KDB53_16650, partial [Planctomycetes bacterium]|nr:hypothetical protein [Planctomycetota bacterium]
TNVQNLLQGEVLNGLDDNGNGLADERGLSFERDGVRLLVRVGMGFKQSSANVATAVCETSLALMN